jgi:hypothetical protein
MRRPRPRTTRSTSTANALKGARLGVVRSQFGGRNDLVSAEVEKR